MGRKKSGKFESKKTPKIKSSGGKFENTEKTTKKKSQLDQEKIDAAERLIEENELTFKEFSKASLDILTGTVMRPIHKKLEDIQAEYEAKKEEIFGEVNAASKKIDSSIKATIEKEVQGIENFEKRIDPLLKSEDLDDSMSFRTIRMYAKTYIGSLSARIAKTPYTLAARYQALKGDFDKQDELLFKATRASRKVIEKLRTKNRRFAKETEARVNKFNEVDDATTIYKKREDAVDAAKEVNRDYVRENADGNLRRKISTKVANIGRKRIFKADSKAEMVEDFGNFIARRAAIGGHFNLADFVAEKTVKASGDIIEKATQKNKAAYEKTNSIVRGHEIAERVSERALEGIEIDENIAKVFADMWVKKKGNLLRAKGVRLANKAVTSTTKFFAKGDIKVSEFYAKALSNLGLSEQAKEVIEKTETRTADTMIKAEKLNRNIRRTSERVFGFSEKREKNVKSAGSFIETLKRGIEVGSLKDARGEFSSWMEDIESKRAQQKVKRRFKASGKKVGVLELLERGTKGVLSIVENSLNGAREERAAAQADLDMNPEKNKKSKTSDKSSREDRE